MNPTDTRYYGRFLWRYLKSGMKDYFSVRTRVAMRLTGILIQLGVWVVFAGLVGASIDPDLAAYGTTDMTSFILSGLIISSFLGIVQPIDPQFFRMSYTVYHNRPFNTWAVALITNINYTFVLRVVNFLTYICIAGMIFGVWLRFDSLAFWLVISFGSLFRAGLNLFTAGWILVTKGQEDPVNWFYDSTSLLLTGQLFPVTVLPAPLLLLAKIHPASYVQLLARKAGLGGASLSSITPELATLILLSIGFALAGYLMLTFSIKRAKREGTMKWM